MDAAEDPRLLSLAATISDGTHVDWSRVDAPGSETGAPDLLRELAVIDQIASFHRSTDPSGTITGERNPRAPLPEPDTWGHFRIVERIGTGAFGSVYRARDTRLDSEVALKLLWPDPSGRGIDPNHALKEARLLARVRDPHIVTVHGADFIDGRVGIWMDLVKGRTLAQVLKAQGPLSAREAALIGFDLCGALAAVHRARLVHGDVKAHNVMREEGGRTVLMDFGTGKDVADDLVEQTAGDFAGTPLYIAPEVFAGHKRTSASDIYSLGVLLFHLVTREYPVEGRTRAEVEGAHVRGERQRLGDVRPDLPDEFVRTVDRALAPDPRERYQSAGQFREALGDFIAHSDKTSRSRRAWPFGLAAAAVVVLAAVLYPVMRARFAEGTSQREATAASSGAPVPTAATTASRPYQIDAALYRLRDNREDRLTHGDRVAPGDELFAKVRVSVPTYLYIVNEDDRGVSYLLFPLPGKKLTNPIPPGTAQRIPGDVNWQVTTAGEREHFLWFVSPERVPEFEQLFASLPAPEIGKVVENVRLPEETIARLRSVGGLVPAPQANSARLALQFKTPLREGEETARGLWVRQLTVENPARGGRP